MTNTDANPIMEWESEDSWREGLVWWSRLDKRWQIEVQRIGPEPRMGPDGPMIADSSYQATMCIFDHDHDNELVYSEPVGVNYGAPFGADIGDVAMWQEMALAYVDGRTNGG